MPSYKALLWDVDGTLLDFAASEKVAIRDTFSYFNLGPCTDAMLSVYSRINNKHWEKLECRECTKHETMVNRFIEFFDLYGMHVDAEQFNDVYQAKLPDTIVFHPHGYETLQFLSSCCKQYCITNGNLPVQKRKLRESGMESIFDGVFISDDVGYEKPSKEYFQIVLDSIGFSAENCLVIGDSLTSDIRGANNMHIPCCWFNPRKLPLPSSYQVDYIIADLREVINIQSKE